MTFPNQSTAIIAGSTGLIGSELIKQLIDIEQVASVIALSRRKLAIQSNKLVVSIDPNLSISDHIRVEHSPKFGFICLGTTIKQAGSKQALENIDRTLVVNVAEQMKQAGVTHLAVVSSIGANAKSASHYQRCKGLMEKEVEALGFDQIIFAQPGPLSGDREVTRKDEQFLQSVMKYLRPLMIGGLKKYIPISGTEVALALSNAITQPYKQQGKHNVIRLNTVELRALSSTPNN